MFIVPLVSDRLVLKPPSEVAVLERYHCLNVVAGVYVSGVCGALVGAIGNIAGGILMKKLKLEERGTSLLYSICLTGQVICLVLMMLVPCTQPPTAYDGSPLNELG